MIIRVRSNVGVQRITLDTTCSNHTVRSLKSILANTSNLLTTSDILLSLDIAGSQPLDDDNALLADLQLMHGSMVYLHTKLEKKVVESNFVNESGDITSKGVMITCKNDESANINRLRLNMKDYDASKVVDNSVAMLNDSGALEDDALSAKACGTAPKRVSLANDEWGVAHWQDDNEIVEEESFRPPDAVRQMTLLGADHSDTLTAIAYPDPPKIDVDVLPSLREAGVSEYDIMLTADSSSFSKKRCDHDGRRQPKATDNASADREISEILRRLELRGSIKPFDRYSTIEGITKTLSSSSSISSSLHQKNRFNNRSKGLIHAGAQASTAKVSSVTSNNDCGDDIKSSSAASGGHASRSVTSRYERKTALPQTSGSVHGLDHHTSQRVAVSGKRHQQSFDKSGGDALQTVCEQWPAYSCDANVKASLNADSYDNHDDDLDAALALSKHATNKAITSDRTDEVGINAHQKQHCDYFESNLNVSIPSSSSTSRNESILGVGIDSLMDLQMQHRLGKKQQLPATSTSSRQRDVFESRAQAQGAFSHLSNKLKRRVRGTNSGVMSSQSRPASSEKYDSKALLSVDNNFAHEIQQTELDIAIALSLSGFASHNNNHNSSSTTTSINNTYYNDNNSSKTNQSKRLPNIASASVKGNIGEHLHHHRPSPSSSATADTGSSDIDQQLLDLAIALSLTERAETDD